MTFTPPIPPRMTYTQRILRLFGFIAVSALLAWVFRVDNTQCSNPVLLTTPYTAPWQSLPPTPSFSPRLTGIVTVDDGAKIWYGLSGRPISSKSTPVLFLHGGFANSDYFGYQISCLAADYSIISIDSRGHGRSTDGPGPITYDRMTLDVVQVLNKLKVPKVSVVGWSDGGIIGLDLAMNFTSRVDRLFAFGASFSPSNANVTVKNNPVAGEYFGRVEAEYKALAPYPAHFPTFSDKVNTLFHDLPQWDARSFAKIPSKIAPLIFIVDGEQEEVVNRDVPFIMRDWIPYSQLILLPGVGHFGFMQDPVFFTVAVRRMLRYV